MPYTVIKCHHNKAWPHGNVRSAYQCTRAVHEKASTHCCCSGMWSHGGAGESMRAMQSMRRSWRPSASPLGLPCVRPLRTEGWTSSAGTPSLARRAMHHAQHYLVMQHSLWEALNYHPPVQMTSISPALGPRVYEDHNKCITDFLAYPARQQQAARYG